MGTIKFRLKPGECRVVAGRRFCNRWTKNTASSTKDYVKGIKNPKRSWAKETCNCGDRYKKGVDAAHAKGSLRRGVIKLGRSGYLAKTRLKGPARFARGVWGAGDSYADGFKPYHAHFPSIQMGPRFRRGDPRNINRCKAVSVAFGQIKVRRGGTGKVTCPDK